jgi:hypothetical protein
VDLANDELNTMTIPSPRPPKIWGIFDSLADWITGKHDTAIEKTVTKALNGVSAANTAILNDIASGKINPKDLAKKSVENVSASGLVGEFADGMIGLMNNPGMIATSEELGRAITEPFVSTLEEFGRRDNFDAKEFARRFHGNSMLLLLPSIISELAHGSILGTVVGNAGKAVQPMYWNLGLGFLGWQTLAPLLSSGLQPKLERYYKDLYRPTRLGINDYWLLLAAGEIDANEFTKVFREAGYRDSDITAYLRVNYRSLTDGEIKDLISDGLLTKQDALLEYIKRGYNPKFAPALLNHALQTETDSEKGPTLTQARTAYKEGLRTEAEFRVLLKSLGYNQEAVNLEVAIQNQAIEDSERSLTINQLREAFVDKVISEGEAKYELAQLDYDSLDTERLIRTWQAALKPKVLTLNQSSIKAAWRNNVISYPDAINKLTSIGYTAVDAKLIMDTAVAEAQAVAPKISLNLLMQAVAAGTLTATAFKQELIARGYDVGSIDILVNLSNAKPWAQLQEQDIYNAFVRSVITDEQARNLLTSSGVTEATTELRLQTWKAERERLRIKLNVGNIVEFYAKHVLDQNAARSYLVNLGLNLTEANLLLSSVDVPLPRKLSDTQIQNMYSVQIITRDNAVNYLIGSGLAVEDANALVNSWDRLIALYKPKPTVNQYIAAFQDGIITEQQLAENLATLGLTQDSINFYLNIASTVNVKGTKDLTKADIQGLVKDGTLSYNEGLKRMIDLGYTPDDAQLLLNRSVTQIEDTQIHKLFVMGYLDIDTYVDALLRLGYSQQDIVDYLVRIGVNLRQTQ